VLKSFAYYNVVLCQLPILVTVRSLSDSKLGKSKKDNIMFCCIVCYRNTINKRKITPPSHPSGIMPDRMDSIGPSAHDLHRFGSQIGGLQPSCHFHLAASINADTGMLCRIVNNPALAQLIVINTAVYLLIIVLQLLVKRLKWGSGNSLEVQNVRYSGALNVMGCQPWFNNVA
jgi:hypothetical protein